MGFTYIDSIRMGVVKKRERALEREPQRRSSGGLF